MHHFLLIACSMLLPAQVPEAPAKAASAPSAKVHKVPIGGEGGWDYLTVDPEAHRLYISRGNRVVVVDTEREAVVGEVPDTPGVHGIAVVPGLNKGFTTNGTEGTVTVFDLKTLKPTGKIKASGTPDATLYDPASGRVFTFNHGTDDLTAIDPTGETVAGSVKLGGEPEGAVADGKGRLFINLRSTSEVAEFDARELKVLKRYPLAPGTRPTGLAIDAAHRRLFSVCGNQTMVVMDADQGTILATAEIGRGTDGCAFDPALGLAYSSNGGDGTVTAVGETAPGRFGVVATIPTQATARTIALDPKTHRLYLSAATADTTPPPANATKPATKGRRYVAGSFVLIVVGE